MICTVPFQSISVGSMRRYYTQRWVPPTTPSSDPHPRNRNGDLVLHVQGLYKSYGEIRALDGIDLEVAGGEIVALLGPNGAGKTTLVSIVAGLRKPDSGSVYVNGVSVTANARAAHRLLGLAPQETGVYPTVSVRNNLHFFGELVGLRRQALRRKVVDVAEAFELLDLLDRPVQSLSGGQARRLHTAVVVLHRPRLLLLDEPTTGVDVQTRNKLLQVVKSLAEDGSAVCYSTHYLHEVEQLDAANVAILAGGKIAASGSIAELVRAHGGASVELHFAGTPPDVDLSGMPVQIEKNVLRVHTDDPPATRAALLLSRLGRSASGLREVKLIQPSLESVFLAITSGFDAAGRGRP
jgi:ABC-2 type transport system ATP-binding protein